MLTCFYVLVFIVVGAVTVVAWSVANKNSLPHQRSKQQCNIRYVWVAAASVAPALSLFLHNCLPLYFLLPCVFFFFFRALFGLRFLFYRALCGLRFFFRAPCGLRFFSRSLWAAFFFLRSLRAAFFFGLLVGYVFFRAFLRLRLWA